MNQNRNSLRATDQIPVWNVSQLTQSIKKQLESHFPRVFVEGEVSNYRRQSSGHLYFSLKDSQSQISAVMFQGYTRALSRFPKEGDRVLVQGEVQVYAPRGTYQILVRQLQFTGLGELLAQLEERKKKYWERGWFDSDRKKAIPRFPGRIGVVTSPTGAAIQDILRIIERRFSGIPVLLNPVKVQGEGAAEEIAQAIEQLNRHALVDVMIIGRGGGSIEDLWAFNEEVVAEAVFLSSIPVISAVGHEVDYTISDFIADVRAPTPSAAAELVVSEKAHCMQFLSEVQKRQNQLLQRNLQQKREQLFCLQKFPFFVSPYSLLGKFFQQTDEIRQRGTRIIQTLMERKRHRFSLLAKELSGFHPMTRLLHLHRQLSPYSFLLENSIKKKLLYLKKQLESRNELFFHHIREQKTRGQQRCPFDKLYRQLDHSFMRIHRQKRELLEQMAQRLQEVHPKKILERGYAILYTGERKEMISTVKKCQPEQSLSLVLYDGSIEARVEKVRPLH